jgi:alanyl-tRNA synthetase
MRAHTASHVLYGAGRRLLDDLGYGGFDIDEEKVRIDFETTTDIDDGTLVELERLANRAVWESRPVTWETVPETEARDREEVAFNARTEEGVFGEGEGVRIVTVGPSGVGRVANEEPWDVAACGGTHVGNTREIGPIAVLDRSNPGEGLTRVELAVGPTAIDRRAELHRVARDAAGRLGVAIDDLPEEVEREQKAVETLEAERADLEGRIADLQFDALGADAIERDGERWLVGTIEGVDGDTLTERARNAAGEDADVVALVSDGNPVTVAVASVGDADTDANALVSALTDEFGGGGGGGPEFAQGGGIAEEPETVVAFLRDAER